MAKKKAAPGAGKATQKSAQRSAEQQLKATLKKVQGQLDKAEAQSARWKSKAKEQSARADKLEKLLSKSAGKTVRRVAEKVADASVSTTPDDTWTVTRLRAEARTRGIAGYSRKSKEQLLLDLH